MNFLVATKAAKLPAELGLQALEARDRTCIQTAVGTSIIGSINMDETYRLSEGQSNRWDYGVGFQTNADDFVIWVEPHSATSQTEIKTMLKKLIWLKDKLATADFDSLRKLTEKTGKTGRRKFFWVAHGKIGFRQGTREALSLAKAGLNFPRRKIQLD